MRRAGIVTLALATLVLTGCAGSAAAPATSPTPSSSAAPAGWRWESYGDAEIAVPSEWKSVGDSTGNMVDGWCVAKPQDPGQVSRPGAGFDVGCLGSDPSLVGRTGQFVAFLDAEDPRGFADHGDRVYRKPGSVRIAIQAAEPTRSQIAATARRITAADSRGCTPNHPISADAAWRPAPAVPIATLRQVTAISACRYALSTATGAALISSVILDEVTSQTLLAAIASAPAGGGPDQPHSCLGEAVRGDQAIVALVHRSGAPDATLVMRYAGCDHNGIDDGTAVHRLTADDAPLTAGANRPDHWDGKGKEAALSHPDWVRPTTSGR